MNAQINANALSLAHVSTDYRRIERAIGYIEANLDAQPELEQIAAKAGLSPSHFQRLFTAWAGISPKRFLQALTLAKARNELRRGASVLDATYASGLSSPGRLHDLFVVHEAVTPGDYKAMGRDLTIRHGYVPTPFGEAAILLTERGICGLAFVEDDREATLDELMANWRLASFVEDTTAVGRAVAGAFAPQRLSPVRVLMKGTPFQLKVWEALLRIPLGDTAAYDDVAGAVGQPGAARAVGAAVASNPVGFLIPCHRVLRKTGAITGYHWGPERKRTMLAWERAHAAQAAE